MTKLNSYDDLAVSLRCAVVGAVAGAVVGAVTAPKGAVSKNAAKGAVITGYTALLGAGIVTSFRRSRAAETILNDLADDLEWRREHGYAQAGSAQPESEERW